ncbi:hypothetical protein [Absidia glauca]|uniref:Rxt3-domain-containing protein n=1 Tax=Absidia glauca TaxID=4829 RepID=A0A168NEL2_ABSGL|nr:hypothetical protein [Absidia glauca]
MEDNDDTLKRLHQQEVTTQWPEDVSATDSKRFKLNTDALGNHLPQAPAPPLSSNKDNVDSQQVEGSSSLDAASQDDGKHLLQNTNQPAPATLSSPFALHPILDGLTNKPSIPNNDLDNNYESSGMRMSMSAILAETGKGYQDRSTSSPPRGQSLPPPNDVSQQQLQHQIQHQRQHYTASPHHHPSPGPLDFDQTLSEPQQHQQRHHHHNASHPSISSMMMTQISDDKGDLTNSKPAPSSPDNRQQQSITNEELVRALTTSIPMDDDQSTQQPQPSSTSSPSTTTALSSVPEQQAIKKEDDENKPYSLSTSITPSALPDFGAALRRLSGATTGLEGQHPYTKKDDVSPSEILGSALAAVARSQQHGTSSTAAAAAIGNLAAITANISHILNSNSTPSPSSSPSVPRAAPTHPSLIPLELQQRQQQQQQRLNGRRPSNADQALHPHTVSNMLDQAVQLGRTQHHQLQQNESSAGGGSGTPTINQETLDGMKRAAEAAASAAAAVAVTTNGSSQATPPSTSSPVRLHSHQQQQQQHHAHHHPTNGSASSLYPHHHHHHHQQQQHHHHHQQKHHQQHQHYQHSHHTPPLYGQSGYPSLHAASPPIYNNSTSHPPAVTQPPKVIIKNEQVWKAVKGKKETDLGFFLYQPSMLLPNFQDHVNGVLQVRVPARYLTYENPKVKKRAVWGTGIYTDDSDIVTMAIHSGKFIPDHHDPELESNDPFLLAVSGKTVDLIRAATKKHALSPKTYLKSRRDDTVPDHDIKVTLRVLPKLQHYTSTIQHRIKSRPWGGNHDGISLFVEKVEQLEKGEARLCGRGSLKSNVFRQAPSSLPDPLPSS